MRSCRHHCIQICLSSLYLLIAISSWLFPHYSLISLDHTDMISDVGCMYVRAQPRGKPDALLEAAQVTRRNYAVLLKGVEFQQHS